MYTVTLADGTKFENLGLNGNNYISQTPISADAFTETGLKTVTIEGGENGTEILKNVKLIQVQQYGEEYWFILAEKTAQEIAAEELQKTLKADGTDITDLQLAVAQLYELITKG